MKDDKPTDPPVGLPITTREPVDPPPDPVGLVHVSLREQITLRRLANMDAFLLAFAELGTVTQAAKFCGIGLRSVYEWREENEDFARRWDEAREQATDTMEAEVRRRGLYGVSEPVFHQGEIAGYIQKYSDTCALAILNAYRPEKFKQRHELTGKDGKAIAVAVVQVRYDHNMKPPDMDE